VLVNNPVAFQQRYPGVAFHGVYFGGLAKAGERIRLRNADGNNIFSVEYDDEPPWPQGANAMGYSLVNINPAGDPDHPWNWRASTALDGSPGSDDPEPPYEIGVVINEVLTHTDAPLEDAIELHNPTGNPIDISGWYLSDKLDLVDPTRASLKKFRIPGGTVIPPGGYVVFYEGDFNPVIGTTNALVKFAFSKSGEEVWLSSANGVGHLTGHIVGFRFEAAENPVTFGRHVTTVGADYPFMTQHTLGVSEPTNNAHFRTGTGLPNSGPRIGPVVISEIMYHPTNGGTEFVELHNLTGGAVNLSGWRLNGAAFQFPDGTSIAGHGYLLLIETSATSIEDFRFTHSVPAEVPVLGNLFKLQNDGENLALFRPNEDPLEPSILVDRVRYNDKTPWPTEADGIGLSLERYPVSAYGNDPLHWRTVTAGGTPGRPGGFNLIIAIERNSRWRYHAANHDLGTAWRNSGYSDSGWMDGEGMFARGIGSAKTVLAPPPDGEPATIYFRKEFAVPDEIEAIGALTLSANYDDGFVAYLNGEEVTRRSLPAGEVMFETLAESAHPAGVYEVVDLSEHIGKLQRGRNVLAVGLHQAVPNDPVAVWDAALLYSIDAPPPRPELRARVEPGIGVVLEWNSVPGRWYKVERSGDLIFWTEIDAGSEAEGMTMQFVDTIELPLAARFYRVCIVE
jgi:hypothetical protein